MRRFLLGTVVLFLFMTTAYAESVDLTGLSFEELVALRERINLAIWQSDDWQEVTVPIGTWEFGEDIPAGHWTLSATAGNTTYISYGDKLRDADSLSSSCDIYVTEELISPTWKYYDENTSRVYMDINATEGCYIIIRHGSAVFTPYTGKPDLGFK